MRFQQKIVSGRLILYVLLIVFITGCSKNEEDAVSPYVQDIVHQEPAFWHLSPVGDKLLYNTILSQNQTQAIVRILTTSQEFTIADCARFRWLDNERVFCYNFREQYYQPPVVIDVSENVDESQKSLVKEVTAAEIELDRLLAQAKTIYRLHSLTEPDSLLVDTGQPDNTSQYYYITGIENLDQVLENNTYIGVFH